MRTMLKTQNGMTTIGIVFVLAIIAGVVTIVLRLFPLYNEKFQVVSALNAVVAQPDAASYTTQSAGKAFMKAISVTNIDRFTDKGIKDNLVIIKPKKKGDPRMLHMNYEARNKFFDDIYFVMVFDKQIPISGSSTGE